MKKFHKIGYLFLAGALIASLFGTTAYALPKDSGGSGIGRPAGTAAAQPPVTRGAAAGLVYAIMRDEVHDVVRAEFDEIKTDKAVYAAKSKATDVDPGDANAEAILAFGMLFGNGMDEPGNFRPDENMTVGELAEWCVNLLTSSYGTAAAMDLGRDEFLQKAMEEVAAGKITDGLFATDRTRPIDLDRPVTMQDISQMFERITGYYIDEAKARHTEPPEPVREPVTRAELAQMVCSILKADTKKQPEASFESHVADESIIVSMGWLDVDIHTDHLKDIYIADSLTKLDGFGSKMYFPDEPVTLGELALVVNNLGTFYGGSSVSNVSGKYCFEEAMQAAMFYGNLAGWVKGDVSDAFKLASRDDVVSALRQVRGAYVDEDLARRFSVSAVKP